MNCKICQKLVKNYSNDGRTRTKCGTCTTRIRRYRTKAAGIRLLGGKCNRCGFDGHQAAFEFHHKNDDKEFGIGNVGNKSWAVVRKEILKCELLCSNCHRIHHSNRDSKEFLEVALNYNSDKLV